MKEWNGFVGVALALVLLAAGCAGDQVVNPTGISPSAQSVGGLGHDATEATGRAQLHPANQSGVLGVINFTDDGNTLTVTGTATGLGGGEDSLLYDNGSRPGGPDNPAFSGNCEPVLGGLGFAKMFIGSWSAPVDGVSILGPVAKTGASYVPLDQFDTVSIRNGRGAENVLACGQVADHP